MTNLTERQVTLPKDWAAYPFPKTILKNGVGRGHQIKKSEIQKSGSFPVIDQGQAFIAGYTDKEEKLLNPKRPLVVFGDHTRCFKYVDFPFVIGADGTKILFPNEELIHPKFFYFYLLHLDIPNRGYNRHYRLLQEKVIACPPWPEQVKIADMLSLIQNAIENQERIIQTTTELKKALMQKLFTEGLLGEKQKQTEIGPMPDSWRVVTIGNVVRETETRNPGNEPSRLIKYVDVSSVSNETYSIKEHQSVTGGEAPGRARKVVYSNDVIFATIRPSLKRVAKVTSEYDNEYCSTAFCVLRADGTKLNHEYFYQYLLSDPFITRITKLQSGASYPAVRDDDVKSMKVPLPELKEQDGIAEILRALDRKMLLTRRKHILLSSLFKTSLNQMMTGQIRVKGVKLKHETEAVTA